ncbi:retinitis pigmentosa 1-like 1 protein [Oncorhynchus kisutch]|uniref:retinitis pigmentosa 1-like 1 protein n=1 Tax=Oncorhynchus kisutch TaxID=8019 RepID=UPI0012DEEC20|nr:retinitis pigmentosa 1-like 1 protein [Oncorhynchus kisutch]
MYDIGDEFSDRGHSPELAPKEKTNGTEENDITSVCETQVEKEEPKETAANHVADGEEPAETPPETPPEGTAPQEDVSKSFHSSVQVMKVLLSPKLDRCHSLPEFSPVYGRKLSTSARGLLDCLAKLQLIDFDPNDDANAKDTRYRELMNILQSLWLCDPAEGGKQQQNGCDQHSVDGDTKARSSSGVDVSSGSTGSGGLAQAPNAEGEALLRAQEVDETAEEQESPESSIPMSDPASPYVASQDQWTTEEGGTAVEKEKQKDKDVPASDDTIRNESVRELPETPPSSNKSSDPREDTTSGSPPSVQRAQLAKKVSLDPDPVWVLKLLNKLEKQFMTHYVDAMAEFKVRWNLDDSEHLDAMIAELKDDVHSRIQLSIDRELRKIHGRGGRPTPPKEELSRESGAQTETRRRRLKLNQSIDYREEKSDDATGTSFSDQRSDDEYCPCETCIKKKLELGPLLPAEVLHIAPVMMAFDLKSILQLKKNPTPKTQAVDATDDTETTDETTVVKTSIIHAFDLKSILQLKKDNPPQIQEEVDVTDETGGMDEAKAVETLVGNVINGAKKEADESQEQEDDEQDDEQDDEAETVEEEAGEEEEAEAETAEAETVEEETGEEEEEAKAETAEAETVEEEAGEEEEEAKAETAEAETVEDEAGEEEEEAKAETAEAETVEEEAGEEETSEAGTAADDETAGEEDTAEVETADEETEEAAEEEETAQDETTGEETADDESAGEEESAEAETAEGEEQTARDETGEDETENAGEESAEPVTADEEETAEAEAAEDEGAETEAEEDVEKEEAEKEIKIEPEVESNIEETAIRKDNVEETPVTSFDAFARAEYSEDGAYSDDEDSETERNNEESEAQEDKAEAEAELQVEEEVEEGEEEQEEAEEEQAEAEEEAEVEEEAEEEQDVEDTPVEETPVEELKEKEEEEAEVEVEEDRTEAEEEQEEDEDTAENYAAPEEEPADEVDDVTSKGQSEDDGDGNGPSGTSETSLHSQPTKSSMESQPGSLDGILDEEAERESNSEKSSQTGSEIGSGHRLSVKRRQKYLMEKENESRVSEVTESASEVLERQVVSPKKKTPKKSPARSVKSSKAK